MSDNRKGVAIVTGCAGGIGRSIALRLAADGYDVGVNDIPSNESQLESLQAEMKNKGRESVILLADVSQDAQVESMINVVVEKFGSLDVVSIRFSSQSLSIDCTV